MSDGRLPGKVALVSGSGRGIGRAIAMRLAGEGARVVVNDVDADAAGAVAVAIQQGGGQAVTCVGDVTAATFGERFVRVALEAFGGLDIIVNNAGYPWDGVIQNTTDEQFQAMLDLHVAAPFRILRAASGPIRAFARQEAGEGREVFRKVVNISSLSGLRGTVGQVAYASAKAALHGMTRTLCKEWGRYKVNVNSVAFGLIDTRLARPAGSPEAHITIGTRSIPAGVGVELLAEATRRVPLGRIGSVDEAAGAVFLLCSPDSNYISGETLVCAGGLSI